MGDVVDLEERRQSRQPGHVLRLSFEERPGGCLCADFVLGFEAGLLDARLSALGSGDSWGGTYHAANRIMLERLASAHGCTLTTTPADESSHWLFSDFLKQ